MDGSNINACLSQMFIYIPIMRQGTCDYTFQVGLKLKISLEHTTQGA